MSNDLAARLTALVILATVTACSTSEPPSAPAAKAPSATPEDPAMREFVKRAEASVKGGVGFDPTKTVIRNRYVVEGRVVCGEINWQAGGGQMNGFVPFMLRYGIEVKDSASTRAARFAEVWDQLCESRPVIYGTRAPLPADVREDWAQRLAAKKSSGHEEIDPFTKFHWRNLEQIAKDLDSAEAQVVAAKAAADDAASAPVVEQMRKAATPH